MNLPSKVWNDKVVAGQNGCHMLGKAGTSPTAETREKLRSANVGRTHTAEARAKISAAKLGKPGKKHTPEHRAKIAAAITGRHHTEEQRARMRAAWVLRKARSAAVIVLSAFCTFIMPDTKAELLDVKQNVADYLAANPSIAHQLPIKQEGKLGFASASGRNIQIGLTALIFVDTLQTITIARNSDCLMEANPVAVALYGSDAPTQKQVLLVNAAYIAGHWALGSYLDRKINQPVDLSIDAEADLKRRHGWRIVRGLYQALTFLGHGAAVVTNAQRGIKPAGNYSCN